MKQFNENQFYLGAFICGALGAAIGAIIVGVSIYLTETYPVFPKYRDGQVIEWKNLKTGQTCRTRIVGEGDDAMGISEGCE